MIEVMVIETHGTKEQHCKLLQSAIDEGFDLTSNHVNVSYPERNQLGDMDMVMVYTTYLQRGSRPGQANKASQIEILENEIKALKAIAEANTLAIKAVDSRLDATIRDFHGGDDEEAVPNDWLQMQIQEARSRGSWSTSPEELDVYTQVVEEAIAEDMENNR